MPRRMMAPLLGVCLMPLAGLAQEPQPPGSPRIVAVSREEIKPGRRSLHDRLTTSVVGVLAKSQHPAHWIALDPVSGDDNSVLYLQAFDSWADVENDRNAGNAMMANAAVRTELEQLERQGADVHATQKTMFLTHRQDLSYRPSDMEGVARARFINVMTVKVKPGRVPDYVQYVKDANVAREKINSPARFSVYQAASGAPGTTFVIFSAIRSLSQWDERDAKAAENEKAFNEALGGEEVVKRRRQLISEIVAENTPALYAINPRTSRAPDQLAAIDPDFWTPKPLAPAKALAVKKQAKEPAPKP